MKGKKKSLVVTLTPNGQMSNAFIIYEEIKQVEWWLELKVGIALIVSFA